MPIDAPSLSLQANRGAASAGLTALLAVAAIGGGIYVVTQRPEPRPVRNQDSIAQIAALARVEKETELVQRAIRNRQAIVGMTYREVETAKGRPSIKQRGETLAAKHRDLGGAEAWIYELSGGEVSHVIFGANGLVIHATDVAGHPRDGHAIRQ